MLRCPDVFYHSFLGDFYASFMVFSIDLHMPWNSPGYDCSYNANIDWIILNININFKLTMMYYINGFVNTLTQLMNYITL